MAEKPTQKGTIEPQANPTPNDPNVKAPADTGDRELSDADLDKVSGGMANADPPPPRRTPPARAL